MATKKKIVTKERAAEVVGAATSKSMDAVTTQLAATKVKLINAVDSVANETNALLSELRDTQAAIDLKKVELKELYALEVEASKLDEVQQARMAAEADAIDEVHARALDRHRDEEQFQYDRAKRRRTEDDQWEQQKASRYTQVENECASRLEAVETREYAVGNSEEKIADLLAKLAAVEAAADASEKKAVAIATNSLKRDLEHTFALERAKLSTDNALLTAQVKSLSDIITAGKIANENLAQRLTESINKVQSIAEKAIEGAAQQRVIVNHGGEQPMAKAR